MYRIEHEKCDAGTTIPTITVCTPLSLTYEPEMSLTVHLMVANINCGTLLCFGYTGQQTKNLCKQRKFWQRKGCKESKEKY